MTDRKFLNNLLITSWTLTFIVVLLPGTPKCLIIKQVIILIQLGILILAANTRFKR